MNDIPEFISTVKNNMLISCLFIFFLLFSLISCNQSDEQREFEREAISSPENFTNTNENGTIVESSRDPDDWRIGPFFQGVVFVDPPFPNPLLTNQRLNLQIQITGVDGVSGLRVLVLYNVSTVRPLYEYPGTRVPTGLTSISLSAQDIARFEENPSGLYRLIIEDFDRNIITYGDIKIE